MAKGSSTKKSPPVPPVPPVQPAADTSLASAAGRQWVEAELANAERTLVTGPGGQGWAFNETKRPEAEERVAFLKALLALLP